MNPDGEQFINPEEDRIAALLRAVHVIAVVGLSPREGRPSFRVAKAMQDFGYRIIPVRPAVDSVLGEKAYARLEDVPEKIDLVDVFRSPEHVGPIVDSCIALRKLRLAAAGVPASVVQAHPWALWLQDGVVNEPAARRARAAGMEVVMDRCVYRDYVRLVAPRA
jgi:predicted CoA-binding protein